MPGTGWYCGNCGHEDGQPAPPDDADEGRWEEICGQPYQEHMARREQRILELGQDCARWQLEAARWERDWWDLQAERRRLANENGRLRARIGALEHGRERR